MLWNVRHTENCEDIQIHWLTDEQDNINKTKGYFGMATFVSKGETEWTLYLIYLNSFTLNVKIENLANEKCTELLIYTKCN